MKLITQLKNNHGIVKIEGSLSNENLQELEQEFTTLLKKNRSILLDLFDVAFICSSALSLLLNFTKKAETGNLRFVIYGINDDIKKLFTITELDRHLVLVDTLKEAQSILDSPV